MRAKSLYGMALKHTSRQLMSTIQQLEARRDDFELVDQLAAAAVQGGVSAEAMFRPPATPYLTVRIIPELEDRLGAVVALHHLRLVANAGQGWLLVSNDHTANHLAIEVKPRD